MDTSKEFEGWQWLHGFEHDLEGYVELKRLKESFDRENSKREPSEEKIENITFKVKELIANKKIYSIQSVTGRFVNNIEDKAVALNCLKTLLKDTDPQLEGIVTAILYKKGLRKKLLPEKQAFLDLMSEIRVEYRHQNDQLRDESKLLEVRARDSEQLIIGLDDRIKKSIRDAEEKKNEFVTKLDEDIELKIEEISQTFSKKLSALKADLDKEKLKAKEKIENFVESYISEIQLKAPVSYWEDNKVFHSRRAKYFGIASILVSPIIFALITWIGWEILSTDHVVWGKVGVIVFATSLGVWLIRILVRMYLSHNHLEMSSQERVIMTKSYLALISEGGASTPEERQLVLQSIFRPSATGIITNDAAPPSVIELINRIPSKQ